MRLLASIAFLLALAAVASASPTWYSGFDYATGGTFSIGPNSAAARSSLELYMVANAAIGFETSPLGAINFIIDGIQFVCLNCDTAANGAGVQNINDSTTGYNTTLAGANFYRVQAADFGQTSTLTLNFSSPITAFGAYFTGIEIYKGTTTVTFDDGVAQAFQLVDTGNQITPGAPPAGMQFFGFTDLGHPINQIVFTTVNSDPNRRDVWGIDDILAGNAVPEPGAIWLAGAGLAVLALVRRHRRS